jgi:molybdopterin synthase sulfur carrier subunit
MKVGVKIPPALRQYTGDRSEIELDAATVEEVLVRLDELFPGLKDLLLDESSGLRRFVNIFVNEDDIRLGAGLATKLKDSDYIQIIPAIAGG